MTGKAPIQQLIAPGEAMELFRYANIREWRHFLKLRCSPAAHPQMREVALILLDKVHDSIPVCFDDIWSDYHADL